MVWLDESVYGAEVLGPFLAVVFIVALPFVLLHLLSQLRDSLARERVTRESREREPHVRVNRLRNLSNEIAVAERRFAVMTTEHPDWGTASASTQLNMVEFVLSKISAQIDETAIDLAINLRLAKEVEEAPWPTAVHFLFDDEYQPSRKETQNRNYELSKYRFETDFLGERLRLYQRVQVIYEALAISLKESV